jgi:hypothetical protein
MTTYNVPADGPPITIESHANDIIGETFGRDIDLVVIPAARLAPEFFRLSSGLAGAILQKFTNYHLRVAIVGDISTYLEKSAPLRDFVRESNRRGAVRFVDSASEL